MHKRQSTEEAQGPKDTGDNERHHCWPPMSMDEEQEGLQTHLETKIYEQKKKKITKQQQQQQMAGVADW